MAVKYWYKAANGSDNWSVAGNWYNGSGGTGGAAGVPTTADDVIFDAASGSGTITIAAAASCRSLYAQSGFTGTLAGTSTLAVAGSNTGTNSGVSFDIDFGVNYTYSGTITFSGTGGYIIVFPTIANPLVLNSATGSWTIGYSLTTTSNLTLTTGTLTISNDLSITGTFTLTAGTITASNGSNITCSVFSSSNTNVRALNMGSGTWTMTGTVNAWNLGTSTNMTLNCGQSRILINNSTALTTAANFQGGGLVYYTLEYARGAATASNTIGGSNTFANFIDNKSTAVHGFAFGSGSTNTFYKFNVRGSAGALISLGNTGTTAFIVKAGQGIVNNCDYITLLTGNTSASPANTWYRGPNSTGTSTGWVASGATSSQSLLGVGGVG